jgi:hypothetical protein
MQGEIERLRLGSFREYSVVPLRSPAHLVDTSLPPPPPADNYADGSWTEWLDTPLLASSPYLASVVDTFRPRAEVTLVRLLRLAPEAMIEEHTDPTLGLHIEESVVRLTIPVTASSTSVFFLNDEAVPMAAGECWYLRLSDPHRVINPGEAERINLSIDLRPNDWLYSTLEECVAN